MGCTSIIIKEESGSLYIAKNLDYYFEDLIKRILHEVIIYKNNIPITHQQQIAGFVGTVTGMRINHFTMTMN